MRTLSEKELKTFESLCRMSQSSLKQSMSTFLRAVYKKNGVQETADYLYAEGNIPIALVAHLDTVFPAPAAEIFYDTRKNVLWSPQGLGADDRAGVFAIIQIIKSGYRPHVIFTTDEEKGGLGAFALSDLECPFKELKYMIQLDRRGTDDCVFYDCDNLEFVKYVEDFGFVESWGSFSDISFLAPEWKVAAVNLSVGYRDEHSREEVLFVGALLNTIKKVKKMLEAAKTAPKFKYVPAVYSWSAYGGNYLTPKQNEYYGTKYVCKVCNDIVSFDEIIPVETQGGEIDFYCANCAFVEGSIVDYCPVCGNAFERNPKGKAIQLCPTCAKEGKKLDDNIRAN